jgi:2-hydroxychromene-2-carboxylate isomerase
MADAPRLADEALAAAQRCAEDIWIEKLRIETHDVAAAEAADLAGVDLASLLAGCDGAGIAAHLADDLALIQSKLPAGASLDAVGEDAPALVAEARALLLGRAGGPC